MNYQDFIENVKEHLHAQLKHPVHVYPIVKNNGSIYDGLVIMDPTLNISPMIYLEPYYEQYSNGVSIDDIYARIIQSYHDHLPKEEFDPSIITDFEKAKERIIMKLINTSRNETLLSRVPHIPFHDLSIVFLCSVSDFLSGYATILIYDHHMKYWEKTTEELYKIAQANTPCILPPRLDNLQQVFEYLTNERLPFLEDLNASILTNKLKVHGATSIVYPGLLEDVATLYEDNLIIIPSSIHEVLIIPESSMYKEHTKDDFNRMIQDVNTTQLANHEILSDHVYVYHRETKEITF